MISLRVILILPSLLLLLLTCRASAETLYWTDFDTFATGDNQWHGADGWVSNAASGGVQSIDADAIVAGGLGNTAALGYNRPQSTFSTVFRNIAYDPTDEPGSLVVVEILLGIQDSANNFRDSFFVSIYNQSGQFLASIRFSNEDATFGIWRSDSITDTDTGISFIRGELHVLTLRIDLEANLWSADLDELPLFRSAEFCARADRERDFGPLAFEWQLAQQLAALYGDNWLLVADVRVETATEELTLNPTSPFRITSIERLNATTTLSWPGDAGHSYSVEYSTDSENWLADLPMPSTGTLIASESGVMRFEDATNPNGDKRFYRILRSVTTDN